MTAILTIDLNNHGGPVYSGQKVGKAIRRSLSLDSFDEREGQIDVIVPDNTVVLGGSFLLGLFTKSIQRCKTKEAFKEKYVFKMPKRFVDRVDRAINIVLSES